MMIQQISRDEIIERIQEIHRRYGPQVIGTKPCTKQFTRYVADLSRLPQQGVLPYCDDCGKSVYSAHC